MLEQFKQYLKLNVNKKKSRDTYFYNVSQFFKEYKEFNQKNVEAFLANIVDKELSNGTFNLCIFSLKHYAEFSKTDIKFPSAKKIAEKDIPYVKYEDLEMINTYMPDMFLNYKKRNLIVHFLFYTGMRPNEILNLTRNDIDLKERIVTIRVSKSNKYRKVKYPEKLQSDLEEYFNSESEETNAFNVNLAYLNWTVSKISQELNFPYKLNLYSFRHGFAKYCLKNGMSIDRLQKLMGHADISTTQRYAKTTEEEALLDYDKYIN